MTVETGTMTPNGRPATAKYEKRRAAIANAAATLFVSEGVGYVSMDDIASAVGLAKPSLYHYFRTKDDILFAIHEQTIGFLASHFEKRKATGASPTERLHGIFIDTFALVDQLPGYSRVVMEELRHLEPELRTVVIENQERYSREVRELFEAGIRSGEFREADSHVLTLALFGMVNWSHQWYSPGGRRRPKQLADEFFEIFVRGVGAS